ncbi:MAG: type II toxin-antitoxin system RelB/DinJ family antitoxin [Candidatus Levybacteria bacterium]|nr:type II toxin-antitoxin system RelB/DinJ family antitoxin [Candidatus Levybacteria bacterium]
MNTAVINIKTNPETKVKAQAVAKELGFSLSALINGYLKHLVKTKAVHFTTDEKPTKYLIDAIKESKKDIKAGRVSPGFDNAEDALKWLNDPNAKYINGDKV